MSRIEVCWHGLLRRMINKGFDRKEDSTGNESFSFKYSNEDLVRISGTTPIRTFIYNQQTKYTGHVCRLPNEDVRKKMLFAKGKKYARSVWGRLEKRLGRTKIQIQNLMMNKKKFPELLLK